MGVVRLRQLLFMRKTPPLTIPHPPLTDPHGILMLQAGCNCRSSRRMKSTSCPASPEPHTLLIEPFYGGSHKQLLDVLNEEISGCEMCTLPAKKWHWKSRTSALWLSQSIPTRESYRVLFASSILNLADLVALRPDLGKLHKILYFHENQLIYPVRKMKERDFQFGYNQILSSLVADQIVFNSRFNKDSFLQSIDSYLNVMPSHKPKGLASQIEPKCTVLYFPLKLPVVVKSSDVGGENQTSNPGCVDCGDNSSASEKDLPVLKNESLGVGNKIPGDLTSHKNSSASSHANCNVENDNLHSENDSYSSVSGDGNFQSVHCDTSQEEESKQIFEHLHAECSEILRPPLERRNSQIFVQRTTRVKGQPLHIVWAHRWEHDKDPELFFNTVLQLKEAGLRFELSVMGETFSENPEIFTVAREKLKEEIINWGYQPSKEDFYRILCSADVAVSTAVHEFFGVSMMEAVHCGCFPLVPNKLVYPEIFHKEYLYNTPAQLTKKLRNFCKFPHLARLHEVQVNAEDYSWHTLRESYVKLLQCKS